MPAAKPTISIDPDLYEEAKADAQRRGLSFSAWVEGAIRRRMAREIAADLVAEYEAEHGPIPEKFRVQARREMGLAAPGGEAGTAGEAGGPGERDPPPGEGIVIVFDAGALIALDKGDPAMLVRFQEAAEEDMTVVVPLAALAQAWRGGPTGARLARALGGMEPASFDDLARHVGELCSSAGTADVVDASVALVTGRTGVRTLYTSDPDDLRRLLVAAGGHKPRVVTC